MMLLVVVLMCQKYFSPSPLTSTVAASTLHNLTLLNANYAIEMLKNIFHFEYKDPLTKNPFFSCKTQVRLSWLASLHHE